MRMPDQEGQSSGILGCSKNDAAFALSVSQWSIYIISKNPMDAIVGLLKSRIGGASQGRQAPCVWFPLKSRQ